MRAYRYLDDDLKGIYGEYKGDTSININNCMPTTAWKRISQSMPQDEVVLFTAVFETPIEHLKIYFPDNPKKSEVVNEAPAEAKNTVLESVTREPRRPGRPKKTNNYCIQHTN